jgi:hypothetical protein
VVGDHLARKSPKSLAFEVAINRNPHRAPDLARMLETPARLW